ncbi:hypothetical protein HY624_02580 [Candidatus Uhrbacteria bacterium]|nr:hypothetical protein [Candidatus Uhrbacteria bacterium]
MQFIRYSLFVLLVIFPFSAQAAYDSDFMKGYNFPAWWHNAYLQKTSDESFNNLVRDGGPTWIAVGTFWYQKSKSATEIYENKKRTANDVNVEHVIQMAHEKGLKVMLKPSVDAEGGDWRGTFTPSDVDAWFKSYTAMAVHYADMAERFKVEAYEFAGEYVTLSGAQNADRWRAVVRAVREKYKGQIGYGANWDGQKGTPEFALVNWWDAVDFIGIHAYFPIAETNDATLDAMVRGWTNIVWQKKQRNWIAEVNAVHEKYKKPVIFTEAGYKSCDGSTRIPWWCNPKAKADLQEQSDGAEAILKAFQDKPWLKGIFWWLWTIEPNGYKTAKEHDLNKKPALAVIRKYWGAAPSTQTNQRPPLLVGEGRGEVTKKIDLFYNKPQLSAKEEERWGKKMWNGIRKSFKNRQPKLKPGEWTKARLAFTYGGYPIDVIREALHYRVSKKYPTPYWLLPQRKTCDSPKTCGIHPTIPWNQWKRS